MITVIIGNNRLTAFCRERGWLGDTGYSHANESLRDGINRLIGDSLPLPVLSGHKPLKLRVMRKRSPSCIIQLDVEDGVPLTVPKGTVNRASARRALSEARRALARAMNEQAIGCALDPDGNPVKRGRGRPALTVEAAQARIATIESALTVPEKRSRVAPAYVAPVQLFPAIRRPWLLRSSLIRQ